MPDKLGFDHLPDRGRMTHRCIEEGCGFPGQPDRFVSDKDRQKHFDGHERQRQKDRERKQLDALKKARQMKKQVGRENDQVYK